MLSAMRENLKALSWLLWLVVASFIIAIFVEWGQAGDAARADATWMARVNGEPISVEEFRTAYANLDRLYRQIYQESYDPRALGVARLALDQLVRDRLVLDEARRVGLRVAPEEISEQIVQNSAFQVDGRFIGVAAYRNFLRDRGISVEEFERSIADRILSEKFRQTVTDGVAVTPDEVREDYRKRNEKVVADYLLVTAEDLPDPGVPGDAELRAFFDANSGDYWTPEQRQAAYVIIRPDALADAEPVGDEEARAYYEENRDRLYATPAQVRASHILFKIGQDADPSAEAEVRATAESVLARVRAGEDFAELARTFSEDTSAAVGGDLGFFGPGRMVKPFEDAAFALPVGGTSELVRTQFGYHIIRLTDRREAATKSFAEVRDSIVRQLEFAESQRVLTEAVGGFREAVEADPGEFDRAAARLGLTVEETGLLPPDGTIAALGDSPRATDALFATPVGSVSSPIPLPQGTAFLRTTEVIPPRPMTLEEARAQVEEGFRRERSLQAARAEVDRLLASGGGLEAVARGLGKTVTTTEPFTRLSMVEPFGAAARELVFEATEGEVAEPVEVAEGLVVFRVAERSGFDPEEFERQRPALERSMRQERQSRLFGAVVNSLEHAGRIQLNQARLAPLEGRG